jgi:tetratricopeptide (TPR) repeat protein
MAKKCPKCQSDNPDSATFCADCGTQLPSIKDIEVTETMEAPKEELTTGSTFAGRYQIIEELGRGGMGRVYRVLDKQLNEEIAIKLIKPDIGSDKKTIERFRNELKIARKIVQKNIGRMFDLNEDKGTYYITMEYVPGQDLKGLIRQSGQLAIGTTISLANQICDGLVEAHKLGVVHRDLKPGNIMIDKEGTVRIMDFGIARSLKAKGITGAGVMIGTPEYMSPEQVEAKEVDQRSDIYSLGIIMYEMLTGRLPFEADTPFAVGVKHKSEKPQDPKKYNSQISDDLNRLILKCLEKDKEKRYQNAGEVKAELEKIEQGLPTTDRVIPKKKPLTSREVTVQLSMKKLLIPAMVIVAIAIIGFIIWQLLPKKQPFLASKIENSIAVISFENQTGDRGYDYLQKAIPNLLITNLERTGELYVATWERMHDLLKQMGQKEVENIDKDLGFELCRREGIESIVTGSFVKAGDTFVTDVKVLDVETKKLLKGANVRGRGEDSILQTQIDELTLEISQGLGIARDKLEAEKYRISDVTTTSLEAYNYFLRGYEEQNKQYFGDARKLYKKAIELDPDFAFAHLCLGQANYTLGYIEESNAAFEKAMSLKEKATEKERMRIEAAYAGYIEQNPEKRFRILSEIARKYPKEKWAHFMLGNYYRGRNDFDKALDAYNIALTLDPNYGLVFNGLGYLYGEREEFNKAIEYFEKYAATSPGDANPLDSIAELYFKMGDLDKAITKYREALEAKPDFSAAYWKISYIYALKEDYAEAVNWQNRYIDIAPSPGVKAQGFLSRGFFNLWLGKFDQALLEVQEAMVLVEKVGDEISKINESIFKGLFHFERGEFEIAMKYIEIWDDFLSNLSPAVPPWGHVWTDFFLGLIELNLGRLDSVKSRLKEIQTVLPKVEFDKTWFTFLSVILKGEGLLVEGNLEECISYCEKELVSNTPGWAINDMFNYNFPFLRDVLARAYQQSGEIEKAIAEYERLTTFDPDSRNRLLIHPKNYFRLAKLYEQQGDTAKAIENYEKFLDLWKDADSGTAELEDAKKRLAGLHESMH